MDQKERFFFDTFGYLTINIPKTELIEIFEDEISKGLNLQKLFKNEIPMINHKRQGNIRFGDFQSDKIYSLFYNPFILDQIYKITSDFIVLSPIESFYLSKSFIHRDLASEIKTVKILFYLDDLSSEDNGPLWVLPGTQNLYDKYSTAVGSNVNWPPPTRGNGDGYTYFEEYFNSNIPKHYLKTNKDKIILFNPNIFHGSDGNLQNPNILRRAIGMTLICVDRNDEILMKKVDNFLFEVNVDNTNSKAFNYCKKYNLYRWINHFYKPTHTSNFKHSEDGTDKNALAKFDKINRWDLYLSSIDEYENDINKTKYNCLTKNIKGLNNLQSDLDIKGI
jgi:hypothetical protein